MSSLTSLQVQRPGQCCPLNSLLIAVLRFDWNVGNNRGKCGSDVKRKDCVKDERWSTSGWRDDNKKWIFDSLPGSQAGVHYYRQNQTKKKKRRVKRERMVLPFKEACPQLPAWASETLILWQREKQLVLGSGNLRFLFLSIPKSSSLSTVGFPVAVAMSLSLFWCFSSWQETCF